MPSDTRLKIGTIVPASLITMLQQMPHNAMVRTQLHALLKWPVPASCETYEQIKEWVEGGQYAALEGSIRPSGGPPEMPYIPEPEEIGPEPAGVPFYQTTVDEAITATVRHRYTEVGTCRYTTEYTGQGTYSLTTEEMNRLVDEATEHDWGMDQILEKAVEWLQEACSEEPPDCDPTGDNDYSHHENTDTESYRQEVRNTNVLRHQLSDWIQEHRPDEWEDIAQ